jgi:hypothetical protein
MRCNQSRGHCTAATEVGEAGDEGVAQVLVVRLPASVQEVV